MFIFPKGNALYEGIPTTRYDPPLLIQKLRNNKFTGYARFVFAGTFSIFVFDEGRLLSAMLEQQSMRSGGLEAIAGTFDLLASEGGLMDLYALSPALARSLHVLLHGKSLYHGQEIRLIDIKGLLSRLRTEQFTGCLRIYCEERTALIFYRAGQALGFFHDGAQALQSSATESQKIARMPGAKLDVLAAKDDDAPNYDMLSVVNIAEIWRLSSAKYATARTQLLKAAKEQAQERQRAHITKLVEHINVLCAEALGKMGTTAVTRSLDSIGGASSLASPEKSDAFVVEIEKAARLLTSQSKTRSLVSDLHNAIHNTIKVHNTQG